MSVGQIDTGLAGRLPLGASAKSANALACHSFGSTGRSSSADPSPEEEVEFVVEFLNNDAGPWGSKLELLENDLSGIMHRKGRVSSRGGIRDSTHSPWSEQILNSARSIYEP